MNNDMFEIINPKQWFYFILCFIGVIFLIYDMNTGDTISMYIMTPIDIMSITSFFLFLRDLKNTEKKERQK